MKADRRIIAIIQTRMGSSRLPGKVMLSLCGTPMFVHVSQRASRATRLDAVIVATSCHVSDNIIEETCRQYSIPCFRGSQENVLDRFIQAGRKAAATHIVRITSDCPLVDPAVVDAVVDAFQGDVDYACNFLPRTFPRGLDAEMVSLLTLEQISRLELLPHQREHVTPFIYDNPDRFKISNVEAVEQSLRHPEWRWCVDESADYRFIRKVYEALYPIRPAFDSRDVAALLAENPDLAAINTGIKQKAVSASILAGQAEAAGYRGSSGSPISQR